MSIEVKRAPKSVYIAFASAVVIALADIAVNSNIESTKIFWEICLGYAVARQGISSFKGV